MSDLDDIARELASRAADVAAHLVPDGRREGSRWVGHCAAGKVSIGIGRDAGRVFFCHGGGNGKQGGTLLTAFQEVYGRREGVQEAKRYLGLSDEPVDDGEALRRAEEAERRRRAMEAARDREAAERQESAIEIWSGAKPVKGTPAEAYLRNHLKGIERSISEWPAALGYHPRLRHQNGQYYPAMIARVDSVDGNPVGIWREYITEDGRKAPVDPQKMALGSCGGAACRLFPADHGHIGIAEGVRTALGAFLLTGVPTWAGLSATGLSGFVVPFGVDKVTIFPDGDRWKMRNDRWIEPTGRRVSAELFDRLEHDGIDAVMAPVPPDGMDYEDLWNATQMELV